MAAPNRSSRNSLGRRLAGSAMAGAVLLGLAAPGAQAQRAPEAVNDIVETEEDEALRISTKKLLDNDQGEDIEVVGVGEPTHGTAVLDDDEVLYRPDADFNGVDAFTYTISDDRDRLSSATVTVTVLPVNDAPVALDDVAEAESEAPLDIDVLANDGDVDGDELTVESVGSPVNGTARVIRGGAAVRYTSDDGFVGTDAFAYQVSDGARTATAVVRVTVVEANVAPVARDDEATTSEDTAVTVPVLANDSDDDGDTLAITEVSEPASGTATLTATEAVRYRPDADFNGEDSFTYTISDGEGGTASATVTVTVEPVNDPPVARSDVASTDEDVAVGVDVLANDSDVDGDDLSVGSVTQPMNGRVSVTASDNIVYTPAADYSGADAFTYVLDDGRGGTATGTVTVSVAPVNDVPTARDDVAVTEEGEAVEVDVLANDDDPETESLTVSSVSQPENGLAAVAAGATSVIYTPEAEFTGGDTFTYTVSDGDGGRATATVRVQVAPGAAVEATAAVAGLGEDLVVQASPSGFTPTSATLGYRPGGARAFATVAMVPTGDGRFEGTVPARAVTLRGLDYFVTLTDGSTSVTAPAEAPLVTPLHLRVPISSLESPVTFADDGYRMVSVPAALDDPGPASVLSDDLGPYVPTSWRLLRWNPETAEYLEPPDPGLDLEPGIGVWLAARAGATFDIEGGLSVDAAGPVTVTLAPGWNQIGSPFAFPVAWNDIDGHEDVGPPAAWDGVEYVLDQPVLDAWTGYFVENPTDGEIDLVIQPREAASTRAARSAAVVYGIRLEATSGDLRDTQNLLGLADGAAEGRDRLDLAEPPPLGSHIRLSVDEDGQRLAHSVRPASDGASWDLEVTASADLLPRTVTVTPSEEGQVPAGHVLHLLDLDYRMARPPGRFEVSLTEAVPVRRFRVIVGPDAFAEHAAEGLPLVPETFGLEPPRPTPTPGPTTFVFDLPASGPVTLEVFDALGRRVASLVDGERAAGRHVAGWDPPDSVADGVYVVRLRAGPLLATRTLVVVR